MFGYSNSGLTIGDANSLLSTRPADGRLTYVSGDPYNLVDQTNVSTIYYTPYTGNRISIYNGSGWNIKDFNEVSLAVPGTANTPFDVFAFINGNTISLETANWSNDTTRSFPLTRLNGILVKQSNNTRRYLGTGRTNSIVARSHDNDIARFLWNYYNQKPKRLFISRSASHVYTSMAWRYFNADSTAKVELVIGETSPMFCTIHGTLRNSPTNSNPGWISIGQNTSTAGSTFSIRNGNADTLEIGNSGVLFISAGYTFLAITEFGQAGATFDLGVIEVAFNC